MNPLRMLAIVLCGVSALALALASAAAANVADRCAEKKSQEGDYHE